MRSPVTKYKSLWLSCFLVALMCGSVWADASGEITGVTLDTANKRIVVAAKGAVGKHSVRVIGHPNRLIMDVDQASLGKVQRRISGGKIDIHEIRVGTYKTSARLVVDFRDMPVPPFNVQREENQFLISFGNSIAGELPEAKAASSPLDPTFVPAAAGA